MNLGQARDFVYQMSNGLDTFDCPPGWSLASRQKYMWREAILETSDDIQEYLLDHSPYKSISAVKAAKTRAARTYVHWLWVELSRVDYIHKKMQGSFYWRPPGSSRQRRHMEDLNSKDLEFRWRGKSYKIEQTTSVSTKNVYYRCQIYRDTLDPYSSFVARCHPTSKFNIRVLRELQSVINVLYCVKC